MNMMMFPKMFSSHDEGWAWLMDVHPSIVKMSFYVLPLSLLAAAMLFYAADTYSSQIALGNLTVTETWVLATLFFIAELIAVPLMAAAIQEIGAVAEVRPEYHDAFAFAAVVPTPLWLASLVLFVPSLTLNALAMAVALFLSGLLIYEGSARVFKVEEEGKSLLLAASVLAAGLVGWVALMVLGFVAWGFAVS